MRIPYINLGGRPAPIVTVRLRGQEWIAFEAFVDTGASFSVFHPDVAEILGLVVEDGSERRMMVGDGATITVYTHVIEAEFAGNRFSAVIGMSRELGVGFNLMGRESFFERFTFCFDDRSGMLEVVPH